LILIKTIKLRAGYMTKEENSDMNIQDKNILEIKNLKKYFECSSGSIFNRQKQVVRAVDDVSFNMKKKETLGIVGETGCGKTTLGRTIIKLYEPDSGSIILNGKDITKLNEAEMQKERFMIQMIFQDPYLSLDPRMTAGEIISEPIKINRIMKNYNEINIRTKELLKLVGLNEDHINRYPHEFSGGQRQRIGVARALAVNPEIIICDEPVSALDVSIQAQIINLFEDLREQFNLTYIFISHDLSMVKHISDKVAVMYLGKIVEYAEKEELYRNPVHPYTKSLITAVPVPDPAIERKRKIDILKYDLFESERTMHGCRFVSRCKTCKAGCKDNAPELKDIGNNHFVACNLI
jgi:oligopeptide transport system ATP-binding protein